MIHNYGTLILVFIFLLQAASGAGAPVTEDSPPVSTSTSEPVAHSSKGDIVYFKNGRVLAGVQVIGETTVMLEVIPAPGIEALYLPRSMVERVEYDNIESAEENWLLDLNDEIYDSDVIAGSEISSALHTKITRSLGKDKRRFENVDFKELLLQLAKESDLEIVFGDGVNRMNKKDREWTLVIEPESSLLHILQMDFARDFPNIEWVYQFDKIGVYAKRKS